MTPDLHDQLAAWAESDAPLDEPGQTQTGADAARAGRRALAETRGRPSVGASHATGNGNSPRRQVRLDATTNARLDAYAAAHNMTPSKVIRDALAAYLPGDDPAGDSDTSRPEYHWPAPNQPEPFQLTHADHDA